MAPEVNFVTTNPAQLNDRVTELQIALQLDEANNLQGAEYTSAGAITPGGNAVLKTGAASAMTLALPLPGSQLNGGQDFATMQIVALDAHAYTVTVPSAFNGGSDTVATFGGTAGDSMQLLAYDGVWYVTNLTGVTLGT